MPHANAKTLMTVNWRIQQVPHVPRSSLHRKTNWSKSDFLLALFCKITFALWIMSESRWWLARVAFEALFRSVSFRPLFFCVSTLSATLIYSRGRRLEGKTLYYDVIFLWILSTCGIFYHLPERRFKGLTQPNTERVATCFTPFVVFSWRDQSRLIRAWWLCSQSCWLRYVYCFAII